jgi:hypothetical protein
MGHCDPGLHDAARAALGRRAARRESQPRRGTERSQHGPTDTESRSVAQKGATIDPPREPLVEQGILDLPQRTSGSVDPFARSGQAALTLSRLD